MMTAEGEYHSNFADASRAWPADPASPFDPIEWHRALHEACFPDATPLIAVCPSSAGGLVVPLVRRGRHIWALANYYSFLWQPFVGAEIARQECIGLLRGLRRHGTTLTCAPMLDPQPFAETLRSAGWYVAVDPTGTSHWLDINGRSFAEWWSARPGALRSTVKRKLGKGGVTLDLYEAFEGRLWDEYAAVYAASWKPAESHPQFLRDWARRAGTEGTLRLGIARVHGQAVAAQFWLIDRGTAYIVKLAHVAGHEAASPGTLLSHAMFAAAFDDPTVERIDFGTGDDGYKRDWMEHSAALYTVRAWDPAQVAAWPGLARATAKRVAARLAPR